MALQLSTALRNAQGNAVEATVGTSPQLELRSGAPPANCAAADTGTLLVEMLLPSDWIGAFAAGAGAKAGTWSGAGVAAGSIAHFRIKDSAGTTTHAQGTVTATGGGGDMTVDNVVVAISQVVTVNTFTWTMGNS